MTLKMITNESLINKVLPEIIQIYTFTAVKSLIAICSQHLITMDKK